MHAELLPSPFKQNNKGNANSLEETPVKYNHYTYNNNNNNNNNNSNNTNQNNGAARPLRLQAISPSSSPYVLPSCYSSPLLHPEGDHHQFSEESKNKPNNNNISSGRRNKSIYTAAEFSGGPSPSPQYLSPLQSPRLIDFSEFVTDYTGTDPSDHKVFSLSSRPAGLTPSSTSTRPSQVVADEDPFRPVHLASFYTDDSSKKGSSSYSVAPSGGSTGSESPPRKPADRYMFTRHAASKKATDVERAHFFSLMKEAAEMLQTRREERDFLAANDTSHSILSQSAFGSGPRSRQKEFYYNDLTQEETDVLDYLTSEMQEMKARRRPTYDDTTVQGCWETLIRSEQLEQLGKLWLEETSKKEVCMPTQWANFSKDQLCQSLLSIMDECVYLYDKPKEMFEVLLAAGTAHRRFGIGEGEMYIFRNAFITALERSLSSEAYRRSAADWNRFWKMAMDLMVQGSKSREGEENAKLYEKESIQQLHKLLSRIKEKHDASSDLEDHFVRVMVRKAGPDLIHYLDVFPNRRACDRLYNSIVHIADPSLPPEDVAAYMRELGGRHVAYKIDRPVLEAFETPFVLASEHFLGQSFNSVVRHNFTNFYRLMVDGISAGMDSGKNTGENKKAPDGSEPFCLLFTDIESSTNLWQRFPAVMKEAVERHHRMIRTVIADNGGYEVKTVGDSFIIAAKDVFVGMKIAVGIQLELMRHLPIAPGFKALGNEVGGGDPNAWSNQTLRVRIGIEHCTQATATYDTIHRRYDYYGPSVNQCARIEAAAAGGQILMSRDTFKALKAVPAFHDEPCPSYLRDVSGDSAVDEKGLDHFVAVCDVGKAKLKGIKKEVRLLSLAPLCFAGRDFSGSILNSG
ncbi:Adenylate and Guanylate cyclase catalytic domain containing protein, putative [Angomonas deanei]|uniref:Adenylate and Guanylate cyclase catalytic domain containing protein, putative n=1 Tax=Angomonas deanei TaxID=59799 RepID=A0A7G2CT24_9TRYP|nr:Adenylate and Guanylate cyclase catalytic domain containing protein, putative [Angomonas deanei]